MIQHIERMRRWWHGEEQSSADPPPPIAPHDAMPPVPAPHAEPAWLKQLDLAGIPRTLVYPTTTLGRILDQSADRFADAPAMIYGETRWTYRALLEQVNRMAGGLASLGVRRGDRVLMVLPNCPEFVVSFFAIQKLGAVVVNAGPLMGADDLKTVISMTAPRTAIGLDLQAPLLKRASDRSSLEHWVWVSLQDYQPVFKRLGYQIKRWHGNHVDERHNGNGHGHVGSNGHRNGNGNGNGHAKSGRHVQHVLLADLLQHAPSRPPTVEPDPSRTAVLQATGGTTGTLKLAELTHRSLLANAVQISTWMGCRPAQERILAVLPMFHVYGLTTCLVTGIYTAATLILSTRFQANQTLDLLREHKPTVFPLVPAICDAISDRVEADEDKTETTIEGLRLCMSGAAPLPRATAERFERLTGAKVIEGYGLTEASPVTHANLSGAARLGSIGLPMPDTRVRIVDLDDPGRELGCGEPGEMLICGPQVMTGYFANPDQSSLALSTDDAGDTWLHTGDVARFDADGYFYVIDRRKDMIIRSGMKVYPGKVEKVLRTHPRVADAAVVGRADAVHTETVVAVLALRGEMPDADEAKTLEDELRSLCREHLAPYEVPQACEFVEQLPRSALGKLLKRELRMPAQQPCNGHAASGANGSGAAPARKETR